MGGVRRVVGLMSGTSADALDMALTEIQGTGRGSSVRLVRFVSVPFRDDVRAMLQERLFREDLPLREAMEVQRVLEREWIVMVRSVFEQWGVSWGNRGDIDLIGSHGQTLLHIPSKGTDEPIAGMDLGRRQEPEGRQGLGLGQGEGQGRGRGNVRERGQEQGIRKIDRVDGAMSLQIVDGDALAAAFGVDVMSDFRQRPIAMGFEGAPLAPLAEELLVPESARPLILLNLGGIANATLLMPNKSHFTQKSLRIPHASDLGPANTCIDAAMRIWFDGMRLDEGGKIARSGQVNERLLERLKSHPFFTVPYPVSTGPEAFSASWLQSCVELEDETIPPSSIVATVTHFSAWSVARGLMRLASLAGRSVADFKEIRVSGGGAHNPVLMEMIQRELEHGLMREEEDGDGAANSSVPPITTDSLLGIPADAKEAVLFAILAHESRYGAGWRTEDGRSLRPGKLSLG